VNAVLSNDIATKKVPGTQPEPLAATMSRKTGSGGGTGSSKNRKPVNRLIGP
jgi:hypothetical protein